MTGFGGGQKVSLLAPLSPIPHPEPGLPWQAGATGRYKLSYDAAEGQTRATAR